MHMHVQLCLCLWTCMCINMQIILWECACMHVYVYECTGAFMTSCVCMCMYLSGCILFVCVQACAWFQALYVSVHEHVYFHVYLLCVYYCAFLCINSCLHLSMCILVSVLECFWLYIVWLHVCATIFAWVHAHACAWEICIYTYMFICVFCVVIAFLNVFIIECMCRSEHLLMHVCTSAY